MNLLLGTVSEKSVEKVTVLNAWRVRELRNLGRNIQEKIDSLSLEPFCHSQSVLNIYVLSYTFVDIKIFCHCKFKHQL